MVILSHVLKRTSGTNLLLDAIAIYIDIHLVKEFSPMFLALEIFTSSRIRSDGSVAKLGRTVVVGCYF